MLWYIYSHTFTHKILIKVSISFFFILSLNAPSSEYLLSTQQWFLPRSLVEASYSILPLQRTQRQGVHLFLSQKNLTSFISVPSFVTSFSIIPSFLIYSFTLSPFPPPPFPLSILCPLGIGQDGLAFMADSVLPKTSRLDMVAPRLYGPLLVSGNWPLSSILTSIGH